MTTRHRLLVAVTAVAIAISLSACADIDVVTGTYETLAEAQQAGAIERGWMPRGLPSGAHGIREAHDLDRHRLWGLFDFNPGDTDALKATLRPDEISASGLVCDMPGRVEWWPSLLRGSLDPEPVKSAGLKIYSARDGALIVAVNWGQRRAYYWTGRNAE